MITNKTATILAVMSMAFVGGFMFLLSLGAFLGSDFIRNTLGAVLVIEILYVGSIICLCAIAPYLVVSFRKMAKLQSDINHHSRNQLQVILLCLELMDHSKNADLILRAKTAALDLNATIQPMVARKAMLTKKPETGMNKQPIETAISA